MCQCQLSSPSLPSEAATPPCAATVCERVGNTFDNTATFRLASARCSAARIPEPPAPTTTASNCLFAIAMYLYAPQDLCRPRGIDDERCDHERVKRKPHAAVPDVVHENIPHADPRVIVDAQQKEQRGELHPLRSKNAPPCGMVECRRFEQHDCEQNRVGDHQDGREPLR